MPRTNDLLKAPPAAVSNALIKLGKNIREARLRRNWREQDLANKVGVSRAMISNVEHGKPSVAITNYLGALWALGLLEHVHDVADPARDEEGQILEHRRKPKHARPAHTSDLDDDF